uniref:Cryptochrome DASH n=2 Tax=Pelodiscus sinensis TaxID=13735 RepID=K7FMD1_PELSI
MADQLKPLAPGVEDGCIPMPEEFGLKEPLADPRTAFPCSGGETQALMRLQHYFWDTNLVASYKETRNGLIGIDYSTKFAPWLALGCISPRYIYEQIRKYEKERTANQSTYWVIFELLWRDYFRFVALKYGTRIFSLKGLQDKEVPWKKDPKLFDAWKEGRTGVPFVDANMRELAATGFMSNRGRQNVASFLTKDLGLDWRMGAEWFEHLLVDYDVCSNYGNWLYSAGVGNDPRENRKFNMIKQGLDYDSNGDYVRLWVPEIQCIKGGEIHTLWALSNAALSQAGIALGETYPLPVVLAREWSRHINQKPNKRDHPPRGKKDPSHTPKQHKDRGVDFYFSRNKDVS